MRIPRKLKKALKNAFMAINGQYGWRSIDYTIVKISRDPRFTKRKSTSTVIAKGFAVVHDQLGRR